MTLKEMPKVGDKVCFIGRGNTGYHNNVTVGEVYEITEIGTHGYANFIDDRDSDDCNSYISEEYFGCFELVDESPRTESDLIANLALRVSELEKTVPHHRHNAMLDFEAIYAELRELKADKQSEHFATPDGNEVGADTTQAERIEAVCNEVRDLLIRKNHDYGDSFSKQYAKYGVLSGLIRMDDKMARLDTLINGEQAQVAESVEDSLLDLIGYATLTLVERRKNGK